MVDKKQYLMALDFGTGAGRCYLISSDGSVSHDQYAEWEYTYPAEAQPGGSEFDAAAFWNTLADLIKRTLTTSGVQPEQIAAISSTSQREGVVFLDEAGEELYAGPNLDMRAPSDAAAFEKEFAKRLHASSGHWPIPMFLPYRLLWFKEKKPAIYEKIHSVVLLNNWMLYRLCGIPATEPSNGVETLLVDLTKRDWDRSLIEDIQFPDHIFPTVYEAGTVIGMVTGQAAHQTGLREGTPVVLGGADSQCGLLGNGAVHKGEIGVTLGTFGPLQMVIDTPLITAPELAWSGCHVVPNKWILESTSMEAGQTFRWIRDVFYSGESGDVYNLMSSEAAAVEPGSHDVRAYIGPRLPNYAALDFNCPGGFVTQLPPTPGRVSRADFARAALEAVAYGVKLNADRLQRISGTPLKMMRACGGLSKSKTLMQIMADLLAVPVFVPKEKEGSALGAAICAGVGAGIYANMEEGAQVCVAEDRIYEPNDKNTQIYTGLFDTWMQRYIDMYGEGILTK